MESIKGLKIIEKNCISSSQSTNKCNKLQKHRWKACNKEREDVIRCNDENLHNNNNNHKNLLYRCCPNRSSIEIDSKNLQQQQRQQLYEKMRSKESQERANCRRFKFIDCMTVSCAKKLLPIFILVNMLPFLYAGEYCHHHSHEVYAQGKANHSLIVILHDCAS